MTYQEYDINLKYVNTYMCCFAVQKVCTTENK